MRQLAVLLILGLALNITAQNALDFDGVDDYIITATGGPSGNSDRTIECWIRTSNSIQTQQVIIDYGAMSPLGSRFTLNMINFGLLRIEVGGNGFNSTQSIADGNWHHIAVTYNDFQTNKLRLYIDGQLEVASNTTVPVATVSSGLHIGRRNDGVNYFTGSIDEVRVWNVTRSATEIMASMNLEFCNIPAGLISYFKLNQGVAGGNNSGLATATNEVSPLNNGTMIGFALSGSNSNWVAGQSLAGGSSGAAGADTVAACNFYTSPSGNYVWNRSGDYADTISNAAGCDSVININVSITTVDTGITFNGAMLSATAANANYQWLDCDNAYAIIAGATSQTFTPLISGNYAVEITENSCVDTSGCENVTIFSIAEEQLKLGWDLYPSLAKANASINIEAKGQGLLNYRILSISGQPLSAGQLESGTVKTLDVQLKPGTYLVEVNYEGQYSHRRLVIQ